MGSPATSSRDAQSTRRGDDRQTPTRRDDDIDRYKGAPTLFNMATVYNLDEDVPDKLVQDDEHLEATESYGLKLRAKVASTTFTKENNTAGKDIRTVRLMDVLFKGIDNHGLRTLSQGMFTGVEITRSI